VPVGGHNVLEPASLATPVLVGPHTFNFEEGTLMSASEFWSARYCSSARMRISYSLPFSGKVEPIRSAAPTRRSTGGGLRWTRRPYGPMLARNAS